MIPNDNDPDIFYWCDLLAEDGVAARVVVFNGMKDYANMPEQLVAYCTRQQPTVIVQKGKYVSGSCVEEAAKLSDKYRYVIFWAKDATIYRSMCNEFKMSAMVDRAGNPINRVPQ